MLVLILHPELRVFQMLFPGTPDSVALIIYIHVFHLIKIYLSHILLLTDLCCLIDVSLHYLQIIGGELGGKNMLGRWFSALLLIFLWVAYIIVSSLRAYDIITW